MSSSTIFAATRTIEAVMLLWGTDFTINYVIVSVKLVSGSVIPSWNRNF